MKKHIFIAYTNTGLGHRVPAYAIANMIEKQYPNQYKITVSNFFKDAGQVEFNTYIEKSWDFMLAYPILTKLTQFLAHIFYFATHLYLPICQYPVWKKSMAYLKEINPDIVLTTHFFPQTVAIDAKKKYHLSFPVITLNPDTFETFPFWDKRGDLFLVCSDVAKNQALKWKHKENTLCIVPPALRDTFDSTNIIDEQIYQKYRIRKDVFTILMADGGQGVGKMFESIKRIVRLKKELNIIAVCAKNNKLYERLIVLKYKLQQKNSPIELTVLGFVEHIQELIKISDLFIGKSGPATILECFKMKLPVLVNFSANSAERNVVRFFKKKGVIWTTDLYRLPYKLLRILDEPESLEKIKEQLNHIDFLQNGSKMIAEIVVNQII
ncbi:MAG: MGDG synthase family glycosyltransferase [Brevinema sp.]